MELCGQARTKTVRSCVLWGAAKSSAPGSPEAGAERALAESSACARRREAAAALGERRPRCEREVQRPAQQPWAEVRSRAAWRGSGALRLPLALGWRLADSGDTTRKTWTKCKKAGPLLAWVHVEPAHNQALS